METTCPLPARESLLPGESLTSLIRRTEEAMGYERRVRIRALLADVGRTLLNLNALESGPVWDRLEHLIRQPSGALLDATFHKYAPRLMLVPATEPAAYRTDSKTNHRFFECSRAPVCQKCLSDDAKPYTRLVWSLRGLPVCDCHGCYLIEKCPACGRFLRSNYLNVTDCFCGYDLRCCESADASASARHLTKKLSDWFEGNTLPLPEMRSCANFWWLERLASAISRTPTRTKQIVKALAIPTTASAEASCWLAAADVLDRWPEGFTEFLDEFQRVARHRTTSTGLLRYFGVLPREAKHLERLGYPTPANTLRTYLMKNFTSGHLTSKSCLFSDRKHRKLLKSRPWMTQKEAGRILRIHPDRAAELIERGILEGHIHASAAGRRKVGLVSRASVEELTRTLATAVTTPDACQQLGLDRNRVGKLIQADVLADSMRIAGSLKIPQSSIDALVHLLHQLPVAEERGTEWISVQQASRRFSPFGLTYARLIQLVVEGHIAAARLASCDTFRGLLVSARDLASAKPNFQAAPQRVLRPSEPSA